MEKFALIFVSVAFLATSSIGTSREMESKAPRIEEQFKDIQANINRLEGLFNSTCLATTRLNTTDSKIDSNGESNSQEADPYSFNYKDLERNDHLLSEITPWFRKDLENLTYNH